MTGGARAAGAGRGVRGAGPGTSVGNGTSRADRGLAISMNRALSSAPWALAWVSVFHFEAVPTSPTTNHGKGEEGGVAGVGEGNQRARHGTRDLRLQSPDLRTETDVRKQVHSIPFRTRALRRRVSSGPPPPLWASAVTETVFHPRDSRNVKDPPSPPLRPYVPRTFPPSLSPSTPLKRGRSPSPSSASSFAGAVPRGPFTFSDADDNSAV